jgi:hypothetical protein
LLTNEAQLVALDIGTIIGAEQLFVTRRQVISEVGVKAFGLSSATAPLLITAHVAGESVLQVAKAGDATKTAELATLKKSFDFRIGFLLIIPRLKGDPVIHIILEYEEKRKTEVKKLHNCNIVCAVAFIIRIKPRTGLWEYNFAHPGV